ncbi:MAG: thioredoxin domain-containing protein [Bacteroidales bacterium]|nr:thioredoxin domain-containing protein [Bacteroidales bacterium]
MKISKKENRPNLLINETSPYLLQHAYNPVEWHAWNIETLDKAKQQDKMLLISIGYSACHWCHVMEHETFENETLAKLMNDNFICVKVDREERPDVDAIYMDAVRLIHGNGGWPLNCFALPDGKPFYGGTYFQPSQWEVLLKNVADLFASRRKEIEEQARQILEGMTQENLIEMPDSGADLYETILYEAVENMKKNFDFKQGGSKGAPKFPMPSNLNFILKYSYNKNNTDLNNYLELTLDKMAMGGIYDQLDGGFARYAVDAEWKVPHFEKMLYDNAQLISLYAEAFRITGKIRFLEIAKESADYLLNEMCSNEGAFYSALDADSDGVEGKFYVWTQSQFDEVLGDDSSLISAYFGLGREALWEDDKNVLLRPLHPEAFAEKHGLNIQDFKEKFQAARQKLISARHQRVRPGLDDKSLTSWNALAIKSLAQLSVISDEEKYLEAAQKAMLLIQEKLCKSDGSVLHNYKNGRSGITGFLEDYAFLADAAIELYQITLDEKYLDFAKQLTDYAIENFYDATESMFWFTDKTDHELISRKKEIYDNVIPSSNSAMGIVLLKLSLLYDKVSYKNIALTMAQKVAAYVKKHPSSFSNWATLILFLSGNFREVIVTGSDAKQKIRDLYKLANPNKLVAGALSQSDLPIFAHRFKAGKTMIYICSNNVCLQPVEAMDQAAEMLR